MVGFGWEKRGEMELSTRASKVDQSALLAHLQLVTWSLVHHQAWDVSVSSCEHKCLLVPVSPQHSSLIPCSHSFILVQFKL